MIVDDNNEAADLLADLLGNYGFDTAVAYSGAEALVRGEQIRPQVVLLDIGMPFMDGHETARRMRATAWGKDIVIIALTAWGHGSMRQQAPYADIDCHLGKPMSVEQLFDALSRLRR